VTSARPISGSGHPDTEASSIFRTDGMDSTLAAVHEIDYIKGRQLGEPEHVHSIVF
jgi:hypothetical protein